MKNIFLALLLSFGMTLVHGQDIQMTRTGRISFHAGTSMEDIDATNNEVTSIINKKSGEIVFNVLVKSFHLRRALMEEHFNENYMESDKYPKSIFNGKISNMSSVNFNQDGTYKVMVDGELTLHNVTKRVSVPVTLIISGGKISGTSNFKVDTQDYNIRIPGIVANKISRVVDVAVECNYEPRS
jgi:polyisoprenoid-binding protein YceI